MGKHRQDPVKCGMCKGFGYIETTNDNQVQRITCTGCNGSGTQP